MSPAVMVPALESAGSGDEPGWGRVAHTWRALSMTS